MKRHWGTLNAYYRVKEADAKRLLTVWFQPYSERQHYGDNKKTGGGVRPSDELPEHRQFLGQWKYPARYYNDGYALLYFYPSQQNTQYREFWTPK